MYILSGLFVLLLASPSFGLAAATGRELVTAFRALVQSQGAITTEAALTKAAGGNQAVGSLFKTASALVAKMHESGRIPDVTDYDALANASAKLSVDQAVAALSSVINSGKAVTQTNLSAALATPVSRLSYAKATALNSQSATASAYEVGANFVCPAGATLCDALVAEIDAANAAAKSGQETQTRFSASEAEAVKNKLGRIVGLVTAHKANCGGDAAKQDTCVTDFVNGYAGVLNVYGSLVSDEFAEVSITSGATAQSDFTAFQGNNAVIGEGVANAARLGHGMGAELESCFTTGGI